MARSSHGEHVGVAIIGAGFAGIGLSVKLREAGFTDFVVLERASEIGGVWRDNTYPGCACDVPSHLYSYSFAPNPNWTRTYGRQHEILAYLRKVAGDNDVVRHIRLDSELLDARWEDNENQWRIKTSSGSLTARILVTATGLFTDASIPGLPGLERFEGAKFHSLHWDHDHDLTGERVAVIGTGASAVQFIPEIQPIVKHLTVFQRSAPWIVTRMDRPTLALERALLRHVPAMQRGLRSAYYGMIESFGLPGFVDRRFRHPFEALGRMQLLRQVRDPELRRKLTPDYMIGCKRAIFSDSYFPALTQPNVTVETSGIREIGRHSITTHDGREYPVDTIIFGTGFTMPAGAGSRIFGPDSTSMGERYEQRPQSYLGVATTGFPNAFSILGPFGAVGNQSAIFMIELQISYIIDALNKLDTIGAQRVEVRPDVQDAFLAEVERRSEHTVWLQGGCNSYYTTADGRNAGLYPNWSFEYRSRVKQFNTDDYRIRAG
ncbi:flavin-containing monooxygenase [Hoyosella altamirensis]|uniref:Cation diffusion facilitator CzcD-associated flavoprotein CzcO n=1 Tax=Hoyosella altamirensis TaxID=616997 RepID=A0A839RMD3_9ACTN|nr:NAD(P)/FAD-dependent oxidoreductase [Hoyosella altamirensis]MBB3037358.1 cation diffusion facilitator CzcD-associated flavoprotein CzcO [Hoyosella altamirensis]